MEAALTGAQRADITRYRTTQPENVRAGSTAIVSLPIGPTYYELSLGFGGMTLADMSEIRVKMNGEVRHRYSATQLNALNVRRGQADANTTGTLRIPFVRRGLRLPQTELSTALVTGSPDAEGRAIMALDVEIDIASGTTPQLELFAYQGIPRAGGPGSILTYERQTVEANFIGTKEISNIRTRGDAKRQIVQAHHLFVPETAIARARVRLDQVDVFDYRPYDLVVEEAEFNLNANHPNLVSIDPLLRGYGTSGWNLVGSADYRLVLEMATAVPALERLDVFMGDLS